MNDSRLPKVRVPGAEARLPWAMLLTISVASTVTAALGLPLMLWRPGVTLSVALGFVYSFANAAGRPALMAALSEVRGEVRGAVLGLIITMSSIGWLSAAALGGWLVAQYGFGSLGVLTGLGGGAGRAPRPRRVARAAPLVAGAEGLSAPGRRPPPRRRSPPARCGGP